MQTPLTRSRSFRHMTGGNWPVLISVLVLLTMFALTPGCQEAGPVQVTPLTVPAEAGSTGPRLSGGNGLPVVMSWQAPTAEGHVLRFAKLGTGGWVGEGTVAEGSRWLSNWADFPAVVPLTGERWAAHWLVRQAEGGHGYDVMVSRSADAGVSWSAPVRPHGDGTPTEHGFASLYLHEDATGVVWLDGRNMPVDGNTALRSAQLDGAGTGGAQVIEPRVCDCCQTAVTTTGEETLLAYRGRSEDEIRDIHIARLVDDTWQPGGTVAADGWQISGCPINGPAIAARNQTVAVAWFTAAGNRPRVQVALSDDAGASFGPAKTVASGTVMGRVGVALVDQADAVVSWVQNVRLESGAVAADIRISRIVNGQAPDKGMRIARTESRAAVGVPQLLADGDRLLVAWVEPDPFDPSAAQIRSVVIPSAQLR